MGYRTLTIHLLYHQNSASCPTISLLPITCVQSIRNIVGIKHPLVHHDLYANPLILMMSPFAGVVAGSYAGYAKQSFLSAIRGKLHELSSEGEYGRGKSNLDYIRKFSTNLKIY